MAYKDVDGFAGGDRRGGSGGSAGRTSPDAAGGIEVSPYVSGQVACHSVAILGSFGEALEADALQLVRDLVVKRPGRQRAHLGNLSKDLLGIPRHAAPEGQLTRQ